MKLEPSKHRRIVLLDIETVSVTYLVKKGWRPHGADRAFVQRNCLTMLAA
jgi:hypothetical protein